MISLSLASFSHKPFSHLFPLIHPFAPSLNMPQSIAHAHAHICTMYMHSCWKHDGFDVWCARNMEWSPISIAFILIVSVIANSVSHSSLMTLVNVRCALRYLGQRMTSLWPIYLHRKTKPNQTKPKGKSLFSCLRITRRIVLKSTAKYVESWKRYDIRNYI